MKDFPLLPLEKIARKAGAERVSSSAVKELKSILLEMVEEIGRDAIILASHARRVTVKAEDIKLAVRKQNY